MSSQGIWNKGDESVGAPTHWELHKALPTTTATIVEDAQAYNGIALQFHNDSTTSSRNVCAFTDISRSDHVEVLVRLKANTGDSGNLGNEVAFLLDPQDHDATILRSEYLRELDPDQERFSTDYPFQVQGYAEYSGNDVFAGNEWIWVRASIESHGAGSYTMKGKRWSGGYEDEPETWMLNITETPDPVGLDLPADGLVGIHLRGGGGIVTVDMLSWGIDGASAPTPYIEGLILGTLEIHGIGPATNGTMYAVLEGSPMPEVITTAVGPNGGFQFEDLEPGETYMVYGVTDVGGELYTTQARLVSATGGSPE